MEEDKDAIIKELKERISALEEELEFVKELYDSLLGSVLGGNE